MEQFSLSELSLKIQQTIKDSLDDFYWIKAEIAQIKENYSGHCYLELVEKTSSDDKILAQAKAMIWANTYRILKPYFFTTTQRNLCPGIKILIRVRIDYHPVFGMNLIITDIDPTYTVGDIALRKAEILKQLQSDGIFEMNKELDFPLVPQKIAIISSETAAGYLDFITHLQNNSFGYHFDLTLFPAFMQGEKAELSIIEALLAIYERIEQFDAVVIIRGGGSQTDLSCFDSYEIASHVAQFPLPVITGIGHEQDDSITDMVAHTRLKTPTAVAAHLIDYFYGFECTLQEKLDFAKDYLIQYHDQARNILNETLDYLHVNVLEICEDQTQKLNLLISKLVKSSERRIDKENYRTKLLLSHAQNKISQLVNKNEQFLNQRIALLKQSTSGLLSKQRGRLELFQQIAHLSDPHHILKKGYSITLFNSKMVTSSSQLNEGDIITTVFHDGQKQSSVLPPKL